MILLEPQNVIIQNVLTEKFIKQSTMDISFVDYDSVRFHLSTPTRKTLIHLSMATPCWTSSLLPLGSLTLLQSLYPSHLLPSSETEDSFDVTLAFDLEAAPGSPHAVPEPGEEREALIREVAMIKPRALSAPFERAFEQQRGMGPKVEGEREEEGELMTIQYREDEAIYIKSSSDRVTVVFSTTFKDETDRVFGRVFLQEFVDARRLPGIQNAPQVLYSNRDPPLEIRHLPGLKQTEDVGYVTFVLFPRHFTPQTAAHTTTHIQLFRDYLHYHIKCSKAYMHSRMRHRVAEFLKVLNRAKPEDKDIAGGGQKERKTVSGRTFRSR